MHSMQTQNLIAMKIKAGKKLSKQYFNGSVLHKLRFYYGQIVINL